MSMPAMEQSPDQEIPFMSRKYATLLVALFWIRFPFGGEIHEAASGGDLEKVETLVKVNPALVNSRDTDPRWGINGQTPLGLAAGYDRKSVVEFLLANKADVNGTNAQGMTPLYCAAADGNKEIVELLLAKKANFLLKSCSGETPLHSAVRNGHKEVVELLLANGADFHATDNDGNTPLHDAAQYFIRV